MMTLSSPDKEPDVAAYACNPELVGGGSESPTFQIQSELASEFQAAWVRSLYLKEVKSKRRRRRSNNDNSSGLSSDVVKPVVVCLVSWCIQHLKFSVFKVIFMLILIAVGPSLGHSRRRLVTGNSRAELDG